MYTKLANSILTSTVWMQDDQTRIVWLTLLAMCDKNGEVQASIPGLANIARVSVEECRKAIDIFLSPDPDSRTKDDEGRRLEVIDGGWFVINHEKYRGLASDEDRKRKAALRQKRWRERQKRNVTVTPELRQKSYTNTNTNTLTSCPRKFSDEDFDTAEKIWELVHDMQPDRKPPRLEKWADVIRLMRERDKRTHSSILDLFGWANGHQFWRLNILSPDKLRQKWDDLTLRRSESSSNKPTTSTLWPQITAYVARMDATNGYSAELTSQFGAKATEAVKAIGVSAIKSANEFELREMGKRFSVLMGAV